MKSIVCFLTFIFISTVIFAQSADDNDIMRKWEEYKQAKAPFNNEEQSNYFLEEISRPIQKLQLGDLKYKKENHSLGFDILEVALWTAAVVKEWTLYNNSVHNDPASYFSVGYRNKNH